MAVILFGDIFVFQISDKVSIEKWAVSYSLDILFLREIVMMSSTAPFNSPTTLPTWHDK